MTSSYSVTTRDNPSKLGFSSRCSRAWPLFKLSLVSFSPSNTYIARYARVRRTEIYCAIARKLSHPTPNRVPSSLLEWPRCEGGRLVKLIYRTSLMGTVYLLLQYAEFLADLDECGNAFVEMLALVCSGNLYADTGLSLRYYGIEESGDVDALFLQCGGKTL